MASTLTLYLSADPPAAPEPPTVAVSVDGMAQGVFPVTAGHEYWTSQAVTLTGGWTVGSWHVLELVPTLPGGTSLWLDGASCDGVSVPLTGLTPDAAPTPAVRLLVPAWVQFFALPGVAAALLV